MVHRAAMRDQRLRTARTAGRRTRYRAQASRARPIAVRICCSDHRVRLETGFATAPPTFPGRPARADSPSAVTKEEFFRSLDGFESFVFDAIASPYPLRSPGNHDSAPFRAGKDRDRSDREEYQRPDRRPSVKIEKQYEALKDGGHSKQSAARIANSPGTSSGGSKKSGSGGNRRKGGTTAQKEGAGRKGRKAAARKRK